MSTPAVRRRAAAAAAAAAEHVDQAIHGSAAPPAGANPKVQISDQGGSIFVSYGGVSRPVPLLRAGLASVAGRRASPAMLVGAGLGLIPFIDHAGVLADLARWCGRVDEGGLRVLTGPDGSGKTCTALRLCQDMEARQWLSGVLSPTAGLEALAELARTPTALLVVVEQADARASQLAALVPLLAQHARSGYPARVLLTVRDEPIRGHWLEALRGAGEELDVWLGRAQVDELARRPPDRAARGELFRAAYQAFASRLSRPATGAEAAPDLGNPLFSKPSMLVIAAYLAVHGDAIPDSAPAMLDRLVDHHEELYWSERAERHVPLPGLDPSLRRQVVALATLAGADDERDAIDLLGLLPEESLASREQRLPVARWVAGLYPGPRYWNRLEPGLVAEHLVARTCAAGEVYLRGVLGDRRPEALSQPVGLLARAAAGRADLSAALQPVLDQRLGYLCYQAAAVAATDSVLCSALTDLVHVCPPTPDGLPEILDGLPAGSHRALRSLSLELTEQTERHFRRLAERDPVTQLPNLAVALNNLSVRQADLGRRDEARAAIGEAVVHYRRLAKTEPGAYEPNLAIALYNLSLRLADQGRREESATAIGEAVGHYRRLALADPGAYQSNLALSLYHLSLRLTDLGRRDEARAALAEAVGQYRYLARGNTTYTPRLAVSLADLSLRLAEVGQREEAAAALSEAVGHYRDLAGVNPGSYRPRLAASFGELSLRLAELGRRDEAAAAISEAVGHYRDLAGVNPGTYRPKLAASLADLSLRSSEAGRREKGRAAITEAVAHYRTLAEEDAAHVPNLANALQTLAAQLNDLGLRKEAAARRAEAQALRTQISGTGPPPRTSAGRLAMSLRR